MSEKYESIFEAAQRLSSEQQWLLALGLLTLLLEAEQQASAEALAEQPANRERLTAALEYATTLAEKAQQYFDGLQTSNRTRPQSTPERGKARRHFGAWDSGDERSADNERIDRDLVQSYGDSNRP